MKGKQIIILLITILILLISLGIIFVLKTLNSSTGYKYIILYSDNLIPGNNYEIYINNDYSIKVVKQPGCSTIECMEGTYYPEVETHELNYNETNKELLKNFLEDIFKEEKMNKIDFRERDISEYQENVIMSILVNDENIFSQNIEKIEQVSVDETDKELLFKIYSSSRVNCLTGELRVFADNTYEFVTGFTENGEVIETGNFIYDVNQILNNLNSGEPSPFEPFTLITNDGVTYDIYDSNKYLQEFVSEIGVYLDKCVDLEIYNN